MTPEKQLDKWTVAELKAELKKRDLAVNGLKAELVTRLQEAMADGGTAAAANDVAETDEVAAQSGDDAPEPMQSGDTAAADPAAEPEGDAPEPAAGSAPEHGAAMQEDEQDGAEAKQEAEPAAATEQHEEPVPERDYGPEEWEQMEIPEDWLPAPIVRVRNVPGDASSDDLKQVIEACGVTVRSIVFETEKKDGKQTALLRFPPLPLPWTLSEEDLAAPLLAANKAEKHEEAPAEKHEEPTAAAADAEPAAMATDEEAPKQAEEAPKEGEEAAKEAEEAPKEAEEAPKEAVEAAKEAEEAPKASEEAAEPQQAEEAKPASDTPSKVTVVPPKQSFDDGRRDGDAMKMARFLANHLASHRLQMGGQALQIDALPLAVTLFLGNLVHDQDDKLKAEMEQYGSIERCFIMRSADGVSKGYGFAEFSLPAAATKAKDALEDIFRKAFNEHQAKRMSIAKLKQQLKLQQIKAEAAPVAEEAAKATEAMDVKVEEAKDEAKDEAKEEAKEGEAKEGEAKEEEAKEEEAKEEEAKEEEAKEDEAKVDEAKATEAAAAVDTKPDAPAEAAAAPEEEEAAPKIMRAEAMHVRTVYSLFGRSLYIANLPQGRFEAEKDLKAAFESIGPINGLTIVRHNGTCKGFGFVEFKRSDHATAALRSMEGYASPAFGKLSVSFQNPAKLGPKMASGGQGGQPGRGGRTSYQQGRGGGRGNWYQGRGGAGFGGRGGMVGIYGNRAVMSPMYGQRGGYGYAQPAGYARYGGQGRGGGGGGGGGYGGGSGYGMAGYGTGRSAGYSGRGAGAGYGGAPSPSPVGYGQPRGGYGMPVPSPGYGASGYAAPRASAAYSSYSAPPNQGYSSQGYASGGYRAPAAQTSYASPRQPSPAAYGSPAPYRVQPTYAAAPVATGYGAPPAQTGYGAAPAAGYGAAGYAPSGYGSAAPKRPADQAYPTYGSTGYGGGGYGGGQQGQDYKRGRY